MMMKSSLDNILNYSRSMLRDKFVNDLGEKAFHADQVIKWIHQSKVLDFAEMTNLSKALRNKLQDIFCFNLPKILLEKKSQDGTYKWLLELENSSNSIETVFIPEKNRGTLCVSSQVGCALNCSFCATAAQGFNRNLTISEIISQVFIASRTLDKLDKKVTNVVMMGMGEPLMNYDNVVPSMDLMMDDLAYGLSKYRVTLSTSGVVPNLLKLKEASSCALAVSLHAPTDELRNILVPINKKYNLDQLLNVCRNYYEKEPRRYITIEYVMLDQINDSINHAEKLVKILRDIKCKINLIPFNPYNLAKYKRSSDEAILKFKNYLVKKGMLTTVRTTRGDDIDAACGQLKGNFLDRTPRSRIIKKNYLQQIEIETETYDNLQ